MDKSLSALNLSLNWFPHFIICNTDQRTKGQGKFLYPELLMVLITNDGISCMAIDEASGKKVSTVINILEC